MHEERIRAQWPLALLHSLGISCVNLSTERGKTSLSLLYKAGSATCKSKGGDYDWLTVQHKGRHQLRDLSLAAPLIVVSFHICTGE